MIRLMARAWSLVGWCRWRRDVGLLGRSGQVDAGQVDLDCHLVSLAAQGERQDRACRRRREHMRGDGDQHGGAGRGNAANDLPSRKRQA